MPCSRSVSFELTDSISTTAPADLQQIQHVGILEAEPFDSKSPGPNAL